MAVASKPVYTSSAIEKGHVVHFDVSIPSFRSTRTVIRLPQDCTLLSDSPETDVETKFYDLEGGYIESRSGRADEKLLAAVKIVIDHAIEPVDPVFEVRARATSNGVIVSAYLQKDVDIDDLCQMLALAIYEDVASVSVRHAHLPSMSSLEHQEWLAWQGTD